MECIAPVYPAFDWPSVCTAQCVFDRIYRLKQPVIATAVDDDGRGRFMDDTALPEGTELRILSDKLPWWERPETELFYTVEVKGSRYKVRADALDAAT